MGACVHGRVRTWACVHVCAGGCACAYLGVGPAHGADFALVGLAATRLLGSLPRV